MRELAGEPSPKSSSVIPSPSVPGSQAATNAFAFGSWSLMTTGRPDSRIAMHFVTCAQMSESASRVVAAERKGRAVTLALGVRGLAADPDADVAVVVPLRPRADVLQVMFVPAVACCIACQNVVPPVVVAPLAPCQLIDQPPIWLPMLSADLPPTTILYVPVLESGRTPLFFSSTSDSRTACRATARWAAEPTCAV